jgi:hypothetical protein
MAENTLGALRTGILGKKKGKALEINMFGHKVEVRQPSVGQLLELETGDDRKKSLVNMLVGYCYVPGSNDKLFTQEDSGELLALPAGEWLNEFNTAISKLTGVDTEDAEKNLEEAT